MEKKRVEVIQKATDRRKKDREVKDRNDEILGFDLVFVGYINTYFNFNVCFLLIIFKKLILRRELT